MEAGQNSRKEPFTIFQRSGSAVWWMRFSIRGEGQIRKSLGTSDEADARRVATKLWHEAQFRKEHGMRAVQRTFRAVAEEFCDHMDRLSKDGEVRHDRGNRIRPLVERYFTPFFDKKPIDLITDADLTRYIAWRKAYWTTGPGKDQTHLEYVRAGKRVRRPATEMRRIPSLSSQRGEAVVLRQLFRQAAKWGYIGQNQIPDVETPRVPPSPRPSYSVEEMERLLKLASQRMDDRAVNEEVRRDRTILFAYVTIACCTGMRPTELKNLNWGDLLGYREGLTKRLGDRDIRIRARGKGKAREFIPLEHGLSEFDRLWRMWKDKHDGNEPADGDPVFAAADGRRLTSLNNGLNALLEAASLKADHRGKKRDAYSFRHFYISQQLRAGVDVFALARNTGTSPDMIDKFYGQVSVEQFKDALRPSWA
ncbi:site-specific integrase [Sphingomonas sp. IC-11]|uniref:tyrosine-type recombinase/integrase n=1 Tax=Sphingomonas sp. IC-11 TaxID=2898528 RepID=UPI001E569A1F|nr:site-specific integrase [Sphingomonas sp. IC-11]MCD2316688.1 site-specific integrase [Sphingomonas sp. IC-11]